MDVTVALVKWNAFIKSNDPGGYVGDATTIGNVDTRCRLVEVKAQCCAAVDCLENNLSTVENGFKVVCRLDESCRETDLKCSDYHLLYITFQYENRKKYFKKVYIIRL